MAETSFADEMKEELGQEVPQDETQETLPAERPTAAVSTHVEEPPQQPEVDEDLILPSLNIAQATSDFEDLEDVPMGKIVLNREVVVDNPPLEFIVVSANKFYQEDTEYGSDEMGERANTLAEARAKAGPGKTIDVFGDWLIGSRMVLLVKQPEGMDEPSLFPFEGWGLFRWTVMKSAYVAYKVVHTTERFTFGGNLQGGVFSLDTKKKKGRQAAYAVPVVKVAQKGLPDGVEELLTQFAEA
jgi:hypothetical protein